MHAANASLLHQHLSLAVLQCWEQYSSGHPWHRTANKIPRGAATRISSHSIRTLGNASFFFSEKGFPRIPGILRRNPWQAFDGIRGRCGAHPLGVVAPGAPARGAGRGVGRARRLGVCGDGRWEEFDLPSRGLCAPARACGFPTPLPHAGPSGGRARARHRRAQPVNGPLPPRRPRVRHPGARGPPRAAPVVACGGGRSPLRRPMGCAPAFPHGWLRYR